MTNTYLIIHEHSDEDIPEFSTTDEALADHLAKELSKVDNGYYYVKEVPTLSKKDVEDVLVVKISKSEDEPLLVDYSITKRIVATKLRSKAINKRDNKGYGHLYFVYALGEDNTPESSNFNHLERSKQIFKDVEKLFSKGMTSWNVTRYLNDHVTTCGR